MRDAHGESCDVTQYINEDTVIYSCGSARLAEITPGILTSLEPNDVLFIDEIHRLSPIVEEYLYSAMEDFKIDIVLDKGPSARSIQIELAPFTLVGATTKAGMVSSPLISRFGIVQRFSFYTEEELTKS